MSRDHRVARGPTKHRRTVPKMHIVFDLACTCGEVFEATSTKDVLTRWRAHRNSAKEAS